MLLNAPTPCLRSRTQQDTSIHASRKWVFFLARFVLSASRGKIQYSPNPSQRECLQASTFLLFRSIFGLSAPKPCRGRFWKAEGLTYFVFSYARPSEGFGWVNMTPTSRFMPPPPFESPSPFHAHKLEPDLQLGGIVSSTSKNLLNLGAGGAPNAHGHVFPSAGGPRSAHLSPAPASGGRDSVNDA